MSDIIANALQVVQDTENKRQRKIEAFINASAAEISESIAKAVYIKAISADPEVRREMEKWAEANRHDLAFGLSEAARVLMEQELLTEGETE
jgi:hypothetical protein